MASNHTEETVSYLDFKISHHKQQFQIVFPDVTMIPKYHFLEHYPELIRCFGPLVALWTMRFEGKHSFFQTGNTLHQLLQKYFANTCHKTSADDGLPFQFNKYSQTCFRS